MPLDDLDPGVTRCRDSGTELGPTYRELGYAIRACENSG